MKTAILSLTVSLALASPVLAQPAGSTGPAPSAPSTGNAAASNGSPGGSSTNAGATTQTGASASGSIAPHPMMGASAKPKTKSDGSKTPPAARINGAGATTPGGDGNR